jgi:DNA mismatch repair ATPase MutS
MRVVRLGDFYRYFENDCNTLQPVRVLSNTSSESTRWTLYISLINYTTTMPSNRAYNHLDIV